MLNICERKNHLAVMPCKWMDRLACAECNEEHPTNIDGNCSEIFHRPVQWRCQRHRKDNTNLSPQASKSCIKGVFHVRLQNEWFGDSTTINENSHAIQSNTNWRLYKTIITTNQLNRDLPSQVTGVLQSNAGSSSSMGFFSLAYQRFTRTNLQIPEIFPFPFRISGVLRSLWCHYFTPKKYSS